MKLTKEDVEAVAKARVNRTEGKTTNTYLWLMIAGIGVGFILLYFVHSVWLGYGVVAVALIGFLYYNSKLTKKQNAMKYQMLKQWSDEQKANQIQQPTQGLK
jgi:multidrug transporter EmrE-like cation transporter